jgi:CHAT domain-containing protein/tetratricopeptide (TPR) repeat protein
MRRTWSRCIVALSSALLLCIISLPLRSQQSQTINTETELIVALVKSKRAPKEITNLLEGNPSLVTENLWETLMALAAQKFYENSEQAFRLYDLALEVAQQLKDHRRVAKTHYNIGRSRSGLGDYINATASYLESRKAFEAAASERDVIYILADLAIISLLQEQYAEARQYSEASISLAERLKDTSAPAGAWPDAFGIAGSLRTFGELSLRDGDIDKALEQYQRALSLLTGLNSDRGYDFYITEAYAGLGRIYTSAGNHVKALGSLNAARKTATGVQIPNVLNSLGYLYMEQEDYAQAEAQFSESLKIYRSTKNQREEARVLLNLGVVQQRQDNYDEALGLFRQSLHAATTLKEIDIEVAALEGMGVVLTAQSRFDEALECFDKGVAIARETQDKMRQTELLWRKAQTYSQMKDYARSEQLAQEAVTLARATRLPKLTYLATATLGYSYTANGKVELAIHTLQEAVSQVEEMRYNVVGREEGLQMFFEDKLQPYQTLVALHAAKGETFDALLYAERAKGRVLLDAVSGGKTDFRNVLTNSEKVESEDLIRKVSQINQAIKSQPAGETSSTNELYKQLDAARLELAAFQDRTYTKHPELRLRSGNARLLTLATLKTLIPSDDVAHLEYVVTENRIDLFIVKRDRVTREAVVRYLNLSITVDELRQKVKELHSMLAQRHPGYAALSRELYQTLIEPASKELKNTKTLCIIPDGVLWSLPFQALTTSRGTYLVEEYALHYAPSLSVLHEMNSRTINVNITGSLVAFGNPVIGRDEKLNRDLCPLPEAEDEVAAVATTVRSRRKKVLIGREAQEKAFKALASEYSTIHLATHGVLDNRDPLYSHLLLTKTEGDVEDDGSLEAREIMNMRLNAELAVLSACETGNGRISPGEGVIGMSWAFFVAGTRSMVVSQWRVNSASTAQLMKNFYQVLSKQPNNVSKAGALRQASLRLLRDPRYRHPFYWAGFVLVGRN